MRNATLQKTASDKLQQSPAGIPHLMDVSRGARHFSIQPQTVLMDQALLEEYAEVDAALGQNLIGVILSVLSYHLSTTPGGLSRDQISFNAVRREDALLVDVELELRRSRSGTGERLVLRKIAEHESEFQFA